MTVGIISVNLVYHAYTDKKEQVEIVVNSFKEAVNHLVRESSHFIILTITPNNKVAVQTYS
jgi:hypothetical protein